MSRRGMGERNPRRVEKESRPQAVCPKCGGVDFAVPYTERAWQRFYALKDGKLEAGDDGHNVQEHSAELENAECANCETKVDLSGREEV